MLLGKDVTISLKYLPQTGRFPYRKILSEFIKSEFDNEKCKNVVSTLLRKREIEDELLNLSAFDREDEFVGTDILFYPENNAWKFKIGRLNSKRISSSVFRSKKDSLNFSNLIHWMTSTNDREALIGSLNILQNIFSHEELLLDIKDQYNSWPNFNHPGILRSEHASLLVNSGKTKIVFDPIALSRIFNQLKESPVDFEESIDAIFISHGHEDHWDMTTLIYLAKEKNIPIYVPRVKSKSLFTNRLFDEMLQELGVNGIAVDWGSTVKVGDIEVDILPFFGEQPAAIDVGVPKDIRNWGNCFRVNTDDFSVCILVDSGSDPEGNMKDVISNSSQRRGPPDAIFACARSFSCPFFGGLSPYWSTIPFSSLKRLYKMHLNGTLPTVTAGPEGIADICKTSSAKYYIPYAHGFDGLGKPIKDIGWGGEGISEKMIMKEIESEFLTKNISTKLLSWNPGDIIYFKNGKPRIMKH